MEVRNFGFRSKTWASIVLGTTAAVNILITCLYWPPAAKWPVHLGCSGYLLASTLGLFLAAISESRRKPGKKDAIQQIIIRQETPEEDQVLQFLREYNEEQKSALRN